MSEGIWIGTRKTTDAERQEIERGWHSGGTGAAGGQEESGYYSGTMGEPTQAVSGPAVTEQQQAAEPKPSDHYLADPHNFAEVWSKFDADPNYKDDHYSREQIDTLYDYYSYRNPGMTMDKWGPLMDNDEFVTKEIEKNNWYDPVREEKIREAANQNPLTQVYNPKDPEKQAFLQEPKEKGSWENLDWIGKVFAALTDTDKGINAPKWTEKSQAGMKALSSAMSGPAALKIVGGAVGAMGGTGAAAALTNPYVLAAAALTVGGLTFYQAVSGKEIPVFSKFLELSDIVDTTVEHTIGFGAQAAGMAKSNIRRANEDPNDAYNLISAIGDTFKEIGDQASSMWKTGEYTYEMYGSVGDFAIDALREIFKGQEGTKEGEGYFFNLGLNEKQQLAEGTYGAEGMENIREMFQEMDKLGVEKDLQQQIMQQAVINASGTSGNVSDYVAQMLLDADILTTPLENEAAGAVMRITGNELGVEAARANRGNMLTQLPFVGNIYQALTKEKAPGGIFEFMDRYRDLARTSDVDTLTSADRFFGGIDADGKIKEFARTDRTGLTDMLAESKVVGVGNIADNVLNAYMYDVSDTNDIRSRLAELSGTGEGGVTNLPEGFGNSAEVRTIRDGIKAAIAKSDPEVFLRQYEESAGARATLYKAAEELGMEVKDVLSLYTETPEVFAQRVRDIAAQHNGMFAGIDVSSGVDPVTTIVKGFTVGKDGKGTPLAWDIRQVQYQVTTSLIDGMADYYTDYYGVQKTSVANTVFDTMKSAQSLLLLGWSPSYFINNVINNAVTAAAEGVLGFMAPQQIRTWMEAFGVSPARMDVDLNAEFRSQTITKAGAKGGLDAFTDAVSKAKKEGTDKGIQGALTSVNSLLKKANDKLGVFSRLSGLMETRQGNQLTAVAIQQYWGNRWKRGEGFHLMPDALVDAIEQQTPGMSNIIYQAVENGMSMEKIGKALFGTYVKPDAGTVMKAVCADLFRGEAHVYDEIFEKSGVMRDLKERIANCQTDEERQTVINDAKERLQKYIDNMKREDLIQRANNVAVTVEAEGLTPVTHIMSEMEMNHADFWIRIRNEWTEAYKKIQNEKMDSAASNALLSEMVSRQNKEWADLYKQEAATVAGVMKGLGFRNESHVKYIGLMNEKNQNWQTFNDLKGQELARAYERTHALYAAAEGGKKADSAAIRAVWDEFNQNVSELYDRHFEKEQELQAKMDAAFVEGYEYSTGKSGEQLRQNFQRIIEIRKRMHDMQQDAHKKTADMKPEDKAKFYAEFNPRYNALIREIGDLGDANAQIIDEAASQGAGYENHTPVNMTPEQTVQATETMEVNNRAREEAMLKRNGYLDREGIRQAWIDNGRTPAEADLMMAVFDAAADQWARDNGMYPEEFYSHAAQLKGIENWLPGTIDEKPSLFQTSFEEFAEENIDIMPDVNQSLLDRIRRTGLVTIYSNAPIEDGMDVSISRMEIEYAGGQIYSRTVPIDQVSWGESPYVGGLYLSPTAQQVGTQTIASRLSKMTDEQLQNSRFGDYIKKHFRNKNFREWFGESKITDEYGLPLVVHHGTPNGIFDTFDKGKMGTNTKAASAGMGFFFSGTDDTAAFYAHGDYDNIMDVYLYMKNPFIYDFEGKTYREETYAAIIDKAKSEGYDGVILKNTYDSGPKDNIYVVFEPEQIKSIHNSGTFDRADPNILRQTTAEYAEKYHDIIMQHFGNENFRKWFGQSKVVDEYGMPLVVHHGTNAEFDTFRKDLRGTSTSAKSAKLGFFFTDEEYVADTYVNTAEDKMIQYIFQTALDTEKQNRDRVYTEAERAQLLQQYTELYNFANEQWEVDRYSININHLYREIDDKYFGSYAKYLLPPESYVTFADQIETRYLEASISGLQNLLAHTDDLYDGQIMDTYLSMQNPLVYDYQGGMWDDATHVRIIEQAKAEGHDGVIYKNVVDQTGKFGEMFASQAPTSNVYCVFEPEQIKSVENDGTFNKLDPNILHQQAMDLVKGTFEHTETGNIIRMLEASDVSTMVHESGHLFRRTLSQPLLTEFTTWAGFENVGEFQELEARFQRSDPTLTEAERQRYVDAEEKFARGFEQYLMDGSAPTPGLKAVFKAFRDYLLDIYQKVKATVTGNDYSKQGEFVFHTKEGDEVLNINAKINGVRLKDIFDRMLTDDIQRTEGYTELIQRKKAEIDSNRHNMRMSEESRRRRAQVTVTSEILRNFGSLAQAEEALQNYQQPWDINGMRVDDATLYEAIQAAKGNPDLNPFNVDQWHEVKGTQTYGHSIKDSNSGKKWQMQYKVVELGDLIPSNYWFGDTLVVNENYPADYQARDRAKDVNDVLLHAQNMNPGLLVDEMRAIDSGAPVVGEGTMVVESGNGRVLSLQKAWQDHQDQWQVYQDYLRENIGDYGIDPKELDSFENPVLVRERLGGNGLEFAEDANTNRNKQMSASENALTDANKMNMSTLSVLDLTPGEGVDTFTTEKNAQAAVEWLRNLPETERNKYMTTNRNGEAVLSVEGKNRFVNALFATLYATPESMEIIKSFAETADSNIQALESALKATLPEMARAEGLIQTGSRYGSLSITADVMAAAGLLEEARKASMNIHDYLSQATLPGMERWTPMQAQLAGFFGDAKNNTRLLRDFFNVYGEEVYKSPDPNQLSLFTDSVTREELVSKSIQAALDNRAKAVMQGIDDVKPTGTNTDTSAGTDAGGPALFQSVTDADAGKWSSMFSKVLDENLQKTFDDGMAVPLSKAESVYLRGDVNVKYETMVQRWLRDFSNDRNLSTDQYLYAWEYLEWWVHGGNGKAPAGNPIWEADVQRQVMQDFGTEHADLVAELKRRYRNGAVVDNTAVPNNGEYMKRVYGFQHGFWNIAGNVYKDGRLVAFLPEELDRMKKTIEVDGQSYKVLGVDVNNPEGLVYYDPALEIVRTVIAGKPEGFDEPRNPFAFIKPSKQGSTPQTMPVADAYSELGQKYLFPALDAFMDKYKEADLDARTKPMSGLNLKTRAQVAQWLDQNVSEDMRIEKYRAMKYSDAKKDAAMLNYSQRYGFDPILTILSPYQFWYTRSMWKWAKRMIDKPALGNAYERLKEYEDRNRQENLPSRLAGRWRIPMPFLPEWMGGSYYVDLNAALFPFSQFGESYSSMMNQSTLNARTEEILSQQMTAEDITPAEMQQALTEKKGPIWENAFAQAELEIGKKNGINTLASQFISPSIFFTWYNSKQHNEDPGTLSSTRTGNAIRALTGDIPLVGEIGSVIGDAMSMPEKALRKLYGFDYNEFGGFGDQQIRKQISQMVADGEIDWRKGLNAMNEKSGTIWEMAADRQRKEAMLKVPGFAGAEAVKQLVQGNANIGQTLGAMAMSLAGGGMVYPEGEKTLREKKAARDEAYIRQAAGDQNAVRDWYDQNADYAVRTATYINDPEELLKYTLYQSITDKYYAQPFAQQQEIMNELGPDFYYALFNKETKNYKGVSIQKLAEWNARMGGTNPNVGSIDVEGVAKVMQLSEPVIDAVEEHDRIMNEQYPGIKVISDIYYSLPKDQRKAFIEQFPQLQDYWDWNREYKKAHEDYVRWSEDRSDHYNDRTLYQSFADLSQRTQQELELSKTTKQELSDFAKQELERTYNKYADPDFMTFKEYVKLMTEWK